MIVALKFFTFSNARSCLVVTILLTVMAIVTNLILISYFALCGWLCEVKIINCHGKFIVDGIKKPWKPLKMYLTKIYDFFSKPLINGDNE